MTSLGVSEGEEGLGRILDYDLRLGLDLVLGLRPLFALLVGIPRPR